MITCFDCKIEKNESSFGLIKRKLKDGSICVSIRKTCKACRSKRQNENEKQKALVDENYAQQKRAKARQRHHDLKIKSVAYVESKRKNYLEQNQKRKETKYYQIWSKTKKVESYLINNEGKYCELHLLKCYVCNDCVTSKSDNQKKCNNCKSNKIRKKSKAFNLQDFTCSSCAIHYRSTKANKGICKKCLPKGRVSYKDHIERAKTKGVKYERFSPDLIYKRDGYKCTSCSCIVVKSKTYKPNQATIDHIIPMSKGGSHTIDNVVTMCQSCNSRKRDLISNGTQIGIFCSVNQ